MKTHLLIHARPSNVDFLYWNHFLMFCVISFFNVFENFLCLIVSTLESEISWSFCSGFGLKPDYTFYILLVEIMYIKFYCYSHCFLFSFIFFYVHRFHEKFWEVILHFIFSNIICIKVCITLHNWLLNFSFSLVVLTFTIIDKVTDV